MDRQIPVWASVTLVTVFSALLLVTTHVLTRQLAPAEGVIGTDSAQGVAMPAAEQFAPVEVSADTGIDGCYEAQAGGETIGYVAQATVNGYGGPVEVVVGMDMDGLLTGISVGGDAFNESPGLGAKAQDAEFRDQFVGLSTPISLGGSGASSNSSNAAKSAETGNATENAVASTAAPTTDSAASDATSSATKSDADTVGSATTDATSSVTTDATSSATTDASSSATEKVESAPAAPVEAAPAVPSADDGGANGGSSIDAISGATITSSAVVDGVNQCAEYLLALVQKG